MKRNTWHNLLIYRKQILQDNDFSMPLIRFDEGTIQGLKKDTPSMKIRSQRTL